MNRWPSRLSLALTTTFLLAAADGGETPGDYRVHVRVTPVPGAPVQRIELPGPVLAALQRADGGDLRLFDASGRRVPVARMGPPPAREREVALVPLPIIGAAGGVAITGLSLRLDDRGGAPFALVDAGSERRRTDTIGALLDSRGLDGSARSLVIDVALPAGQPVTLDVEASPDLETWRPVAEQVAYHASAAPAPERLGLGDAHLTHDWLRVTWRASTRLVAPVVIRSAVLAVASVAALSGPAVTVRLAPLTDPRAVELALPFATPLAGLGIAPMTDAIVPVRLFGRADAEQPWVLLGQGTAARVGGRDRGGTIPLAGATPRLLRIEADARSDGFVGGAAITLRFAPAGIVFVGSGSALTLAAGRPDGEDRLLPLANLLAGGDGAAGALPEARLGPVAADPPDLSPTPAGRPWRAIGLWAALLVATALLGWMAWRLARQRPASGAAPPG